MDLDGIIKLSEAQCREATVGAQIAKTMAETQVIWQEVYKKQLENVALFLYIKWDEQAHDNLLKQRNIALRRERQIREKQEVLEKKIRAINGLITGGTGSLEAIQQGWLGFFYVRNFLEPSTIIKAYRKVKPDADVFITDSWTHPWAANGALVLGIPQGNDLTALFQWAARGNYYPKQGWGAWEYLTQFIEALNDAANEEAAELEKKVADAHAAALELSKIDWKRLETPAGLQPKQP